MDVLGGGAVGHLGHHVVLSGKGGGDRIEAGKGLEKLVVARAPREREIARGPEIDQLVVDRHLLRQGGGGEEFGVLSAGARGHQAGGGRIDAIAIGGGPLQVVLRIHGTAEVGLEIGPLG